MTSDNVFGSHELTPDLLRSTSFPEEDGRVDAAEVQAFLDRVASSLEVFMAGDAPQALRAEFDRNAAIATQILDAGQTASEQLRRQAAEEAKRILDEARDATLGLRETVEGEIAQARSQVEAMRGTFIQDLRDLYDRIGASLYRFERAAEEANVAPIQEPTRSGSSSSAEPEPAVPAPAPTSEGADLPEGAKPPAWQQLPPEAYSTLEPDADAAPGSTEVPAPAAGSTPVPPPSSAALEAEVPGGPEPDPFAPVVEDEPLAPGEPLVDLRSFGATVEDADTTMAPADTATAPAEPANVTETGGSWLDPGTDVPAVAPQAAPEPDAGGSWLETPLDPDPEAGQPADPALARDDALAQALIGDPASEAPPADAPPADAAPAMQAPAAGASPDAVAVRQLILDSLAAGQTRETVEAYLREHMGLLEPGALVDAALTSTDTPPQQ